MGDWGLYGFVLVMTAIVMLRLERLGKQIEAVSVRLRMNVARTEEEREVQSGHRAEGAAPVLDILGDHARSCRGYDSSSSIERCGLPFFDFDLALRTLLELLVMRQSNNRCRLTILIRMHPVIWGDLTRCCQPDHVNRWHVAALAA